MAYNPPFYRTLYAFAASALVGALGTDLAYWASADFLWLDMSDWLVTTGAVVGFVALIVGLIETVASRRSRRPAWSYGLLSFIAWVLAVLNTMVHTRDGWTAVIPLGLLLSALTVLLLVVAWWALRARPATYSAAEITA